MQNIKKKSNIGFFLIFGKKPAGMLSFNMPADGNHQWMIDSFRSATKYLDYQELMQERIKNLQNQIALAIL